MVGTGVFVAGTGVSVGWRVLVEDDIGELVGEGVSSGVASAMLSVAAVTVTAAGPAVWVELQPERVLIAPQLQTSRTTTPRLVMIALRAEHGRRQFRITVSTSTRITIIHSGWSERYT